MILRNRFVKWKELQNIIIITVHLNQSDCSIAPSKLAPVDGSRVLLAQLGPLDEKYIGEVVEQTTGKGQPVDAAVRLDEY